MQIRVGPVSTYAPWLADSEGPVLQVSSVFSDSYTLSFSYSERFLEL